MQTKRAFYSHSNDKADKLYAISHKMNYREKRSSPWPLVIFIILYSLELTSKLDYDVGFTLPIIHGILQYLNRQRFPPCQNQLTTLASSQSHHPCRSWHLPIQDMSCNTRLKFHLSHKVMNKLEAFFGHIEMVLSWRKFLFVTKSNIGHIGPNVKRST